jgi:hypothetical protein
MDRYLDMGELIDDLSMLCPKPVKANPPSLWRSLEDIRKLYASKKNASGLTRTKLVGSFVVAALISIILFLFSNS